MIKLQSLILLCSVWPKKVCGTVVMKHTKGNAVTLNIIIDAEDHTTALI